MLKYGDQLKNFEIHMMKKLKNGEKFCERRKVLNNIEKLGNSIKSIEIVGKNQNVSTNF